MQIKIVLQIKGGVKNEKALFRSAYDNYNAGFFFLFLLLADNNDDWLHARGNKCSDKYGNEVWLTGANWFGFNCSENVFHGAWYDRTILTDIADRGIGFSGFPFPRNYYTAG